MEDRNERKLWRCIIKEEVTEEEISQIVSKWTGIPVSKLSWRRKRKTS